MGIKFHFFLTLSTLPFIFPVPVYFDDCGNGEFLSMDLEPCYTLPCHFEEGARANLTIVFKPRQKSNYLRVYSTLRTGGLFNYQVEVKDDDPEVCKSIGKNDWGKIDCPTVPGQMYTFKVSRKFPVSTTWNVFRYSKIKLLNEHGRTVACADWYLQFNRHNRNDQNKFLFSR